MIEQYTSNTSSGFTIYKINKPSESILISWSQYQADQHAAGRRAITD